jgi:hydroxypyruvate reductase
MTEEQREQALELVRAALLAVDPAAAVRRQLGLRGERLLVGGRQVADLSRVERVLVLGGGKAAVPMAAACEALLGERVSDGLVITKHGHRAGELPGRIRVLEAGHPLPDAAGVQATGRMLALLSGLTDRDLVLCLISGGGSALMTLPAPGVTLEHLERVNHLLLGAGAPIEAVNAVRKHLSQLKGGRLAALASPARVVSLILSDVVGNPLDVIASGPTAPDGSTFAEALSVLERFGLSDRVPGPVLTHLRAGAAGQQHETLKPGDARLERVHNHIVGSNEQAAEAAAARARELGFSALVLSTHVQGEAREVARVYAAILRDLALCGRPLPRPACVVAGGETTVTLRRRDGRGGRNQELALAAALDLQGLQDVALVALATDGTDGPTDAGGALADGTTAARARALGLDLREHLDRNDAYPLLRALGDLLLLGPTGTNVNDLTLLLAF